jgi:histidinol-phosphate aminotransferase
VSSKHREQETKPWFAPFVPPGLATAKPYDASHHDYAWRHRELHRMMSNECPLPPPQAVIDAALAALREGNLYPNSAWELRDALAAASGIDPQTVMLGNGSTEVLDVVIRALFREGDEAIIHVPTYNYFETQVRLHGGNPILVPLKPDHGFDTDALIAEVTPRTKAFLLCSPNNPTGNSWTVPELERILASGLPVIVDQAYLECGYSTSFAQLVARWPNLIVARTMSKGYGLAALRVGYLVADPALIDLLLRLRIPFSISLVAARACLAAVIDPQILEERRVYISTERDRLLAALATIPSITAFPSDGNFILMDVGPTGVTSTEIVEFAKREGLLLLRAVTSHGLGSSHVRVTVGTHEENDLFLEVFQRAIEPRRIAPPPAPVAAA